MTQALFRDDAYRAETEAVVLMSERSEERRVGKECVP